MKLRSIPHPKTLRCSAKEIPADLSLTGEVEFKAADEKVSNSKPTVTLRANSGVPMRVAGFPAPVIVDMQGARFNKKRTPIIQDHDVEKRVGYTTTQTVSATEITADGVVTPNTTNAKEFLADAKDGYPFETSIGATILNSEYIDEGEKVKVNGKNWEGPLIVSRETLIRELSVTVLGADSDTSAKVAATHFKKGNVMDFEAWIKDTLGLELSDLNADRKKKLQAEFDRIQGLQANQDTDPPEPKKTKTKPKKVLATVGGGGDDDDADDDTRLQATRDREGAETERCDAIRSLCAQYGEDLSETEIEFGGKKYKGANAFKAHAIRAGISAEKVELHLIRASRANPEMHSTRPHMMPKDIQAAAMEAAIIRQCGLMAASGQNVNTGKKYGYETYYDEKTLELSHGRQYQGVNSIQALLDMQIRAAGMYYAGMDRHSSDFVGTAIKAWEACQERNLKASGFSNLNIVNVLESVMHKAAYASFVHTEGVWSLVCGRKPLNDFKTHNLYRLDINGHYKQVDQSGELKHVGMTDSKKTIAADTYGAMITIDRKTIRNDDMGLVLDTAKGLGSLGALRIEESVWVLWLSNLGSFYHTNNKNLITNVLGLAGLEAARQKFRNQVVNGKPVGVSPTILVVGTTLETTGRQLYQEEKLAATGDTNALVFTNNPNKGLYRPVVTPYLNNTDITDDSGKALTGQSDTQWALFADPSAPQGAALVIGFLDGRETPYFDSAETQFNIPGGMQFRSYLDWGVALHVHQMSVKSTGAG